MIKALYWVPALAMLFFAIVFFSDWVTRFKAIRRYLKYGICAGLIVVGTDLLILAITPSSGRPTVLMGLIAEPIAFLQLMGFTMLGMYYLAASGYPSFPVLLQKFSVPSDESNTDENMPENQANAGAATTDSIQPGNSTLHETPAQIHASNRNYPALDLLLDINWKAYFLTIFGVSIIGILYTVVLFWLTTPQLSEILQKAVVSPSAGFENAATIQAILLVLGVAVTEEIIFRLGIQSFFVKYLKLEGASYWVAILITSVLWTLGHACALDPEWVKLAQIFPMGLMLGWLFRKYGAESTILAHGLYNVVLVFLAPYLLG